MPTFQRKQLRQSLGLNYLRDTVVGRCTNTLAAGGSFHVIDTTRADLSLSGQSLYGGADLRVVGMGDFRIATFNTGTGAYQTLQTSGTALVYSAEYEVSRLVPAADKDRAIDFILAGLPVRREVPLNTEVGRKYYSVPSEIDKVLDVYYFADATNSLDRGKARFAWYDVVETPTGSELRIEPALGASYQIVFDAITRMTLGAAEEATINLPSEQWVLFGAEAHCWELLSKGKPAKETTAYRETAARAAGAFRRITANRVPHVSKDIQLPDAV